MPPNVVAVLILMMASVELCGTEGSAAACMRLLQPQNHMNGTNVYVLHRNSKKNTYHIG